MPIDVKSELTRPVALILAVLAVLGWVLFILASWSGTSTQKAQRLQIIQLTESRDQMATDLARQVEASGSLSELRARVEATRADLSRVTQTRDDIQSELAASQRNLSAARRDLSDADRTLASQNQKLSDQAAQPAPEAEPQVRRGRRGYTRRGRRTSRSFRTIHR